MVLYQKRSTKKYVQIDVFAYQGRKDPMASVTETESESHKVERLIEIQLNKHGYYKVNESER